MHQPKIHVYSDSDALMTAAARRWIALALEAIEARACFHVALSGGSTPAALHLRLGQQDLAGQVDWHQTHIWFGDERCVGPEHPDSNYRMARETLLRHVPLPSEHIHRISGESPSPEEAAQEYALALDNLLPKNRDIPCFDLIMLGIGPDGHIASLFPGSNNLKERQASVSAAWIDTQKGWRISLTLPVILAARHIMILASGEGKADILAQALGTSPDASTVPARLLTPLPQAEWFIDQAAATRLQDAQSSNNT